MDFQSYRHDYTISHLPLFPSQHVTVVLRVNSKEEAAPWITLKHFNFNIKCGIQILFFVNIFLRTFFPYGSIFFLSLSISLFLSSYLNSSVSSSVAFFCWKEGNQYDWTTSCVLIPVQETEQTELNSNTNSKREGRREHEQRKGGGRGSRERVGERERGKERDFFSSCKPFQLCSVLRTETGWERRRESALHWGNWKRKKRNWDCVAL